MPPTHIAVLGGGLTGLSSAFHLSRRFPGARITLLEKSTRLGGWVRSERVRVKLSDGPGAKEASVLLEAGPRTLRPNGQAVLELINLLHLAPQLITVPRSAPAALNRFLHLPGTRGLVRIPSSLPALLTSPLARTLIPAVLKDALGRENSFAKSSSAEDPADESVESFLSRRFGPDFARTFGSALVHGIYAADARRLSMRAAFPSLMEMTARGKGSVVRGALSMSLGRRGLDAKSTIEQYDLGEVKNMMDGVSVYSFKEGMSTLTNALEEALARSNNVEIAKDAEVGRIRGRGTDEGFEIQTVSGALLKPSHLVSALPLRILHSLLENPKSSSSPPSVSLPHLTSNVSSSVTVVNLIFPSTIDVLPIHPPGFGYLVPRSSGDYGEQIQNRLGILGTVFDSSALAAQDTDVDGDLLPITKMTVMLGGPHPVSSADQESPRFIQELLQQLSVHLSSSPNPPPLPRPLLVRVHHHKSCIPTPMVGHELRMTELREAVIRLWGGNAEVVGAEVGGVSVGACIEQGKNVGREW